MEWIWFVLSGLCAGIVSGMGMGGGTILIPILTLILGLSQHTAQGINMLAFLPAALLALWVHKKDGRLCKKSGLSMLAGGLPGAIAGAFIATYLHGEALKKAFGAFLIILAIWQWSKIKSPIKNNERR